MHYWIYVVLENDMEILVEMVKFIFTCITSYANIVIEILISLYVLFHRTWSLFYRPEWYR